MIMGWKNWPYWLKGGLISIFVFLVSSIPSLFSFQIDALSIVALLLGILGTLLWVVFANYFPKESFPLFIETIVFIVSVLSSFLVGSLIGWIYGKIKSK
jgi:hypothetical protein